MEKISDLEYLSSLSFNQLKSFKGIGRVKAIQIKAVIELSKRLSLGQEKMHKITCPKDVYELTQVGYMGKKQEILKTILLDHSNKIISVKLNAIGNIASIHLGMKELFSEPLKQLAPKIILVHNHPSGNLEVSKSDRYFTNQVLSCSKMLEIELVDHIVIAKDKYVSFKELGYL